MLPKRYSFPPHKPPVPPINHGWLLPSTADTLRTVLGPQVKTVVEMGSWLGRSTKFILDNAPNAIVYCVDHWKGSDEHFEPGDHGLPNILDVIPVLYATFLVNMWEYRTRIVPVREKTADGLYVLGLNGIEPDVVYVDAAHDYASVVHDIKSVIARWPGAKVVGDDYCMADVKAAVQDVARVHKFKVYDGGNGWRLDPLNNQTGGNLPPSSN